MLFGLQYGAANLKCRTNYICFFFVPATLFHSALAGAPVRKWIIVTLVDAYREQSREQRQEYADFVVFQYNCHSRVLAKFVGMVEHLSGANLFSIQL
jgi:precorrin-3B methylase